jgi:hypothetical protein
MMNAKRTVRPSPIAGTWYSANPSRLKDTVSRYIDDARNPVLPGEVLALVAPHAGYLYSGSVAGHAFKTVQGTSFDHVCVLSPMHQYYPQPLLTSAHQAYRTPLGEIPLADAILTQINTRLKAKSGLSCTLSPMTRSIRLKLSCLSSR